MLSLVQCKCKGRRYKVSAEEVRRFAADTEELGYSLEAGSGCFFVTRLGLALGLGLGSPVLPYHMHLRTHHRP